MRGVAHGAEARRALGRRPAALPARHPAGHGQRARREPVRHSCWRARAGVVHRHRHRADPDGRAGRRRGRGPPGPGAAGPRPPRRRAGGRRVLREPRVARPVPAVADPAVHPGRRRARPARPSRSPRPSAARWGSPATTTRSGSPAPSAAAATAPPPSSRTSGTGPSRASSRWTQRAAGSSTSRCPTTGSSAPCTPRKAVPAVARDRRPRRCAATGWAWSARTRPSR